MFNSWNILNFFALKLVVKDFNEIFQDPELLGNLRDLTLSPGSGMNFEMNALENLYKERPVKASAILAYRSQELIGWALFSQEKSSYCFIHTCGYDPIDGILFQVYVKPEQRRRGIGRQLINKAQELAGTSRLCVSKWDPTSSVFFNQFLDFDFKSL